MLLRSVHHAMVTVAILATMAYNVGPSLHACAGVSWLYARQADHFTWTGAFVISWISQSYTKMDIGGVKLLSLRCELLYGHHGTLVQV